MNLADIRAVLEAQAHQVVVLQEQLEQLRQCLDDLTTEVSMRDTKLFRGLRFLCAEIERLKQ